MKPEIVYALLNKKKVTKLVGATENNISVIGANGELKDSGVPLSRIYNHLNSWADIKAACADGLADTVVSPGDVFICGSSIYENQESLYPWTILKVFPNKITMAEDEGYGASTYWGSDWEMLDEILCELPAIPVAANTTQIGIQYEIKYEWTFQGEVLLGDTLQFLCDYNNMNDTPVTVLLRRNGVQVDYSDVIASESLELEDYEISAGDYRYEYSEEGYMQGNDSIQNQLAHLDADFMAVTQGHRMIKKEDIPSNFSTFPTAYDFNTWLDDGIHEGTLSGYPFEAYALFDGGVSLEGHAGADRNFNIFCEIVGGN